MTSPALSLPRHFNHTFHPCEISTRGSGQAPEICARHSFRVFCSAQYMTAAILTGATNCRTEHSGRNTQHGQWSATILTEAAVWCTCHTAACRPPPCHPLKAAKLHAWLPLLLGPPAWACNVQRVPSDEPIPVVPQIVLYPTANCAVSHCRKPALHANSKYVLGLQLK